MLARRSLNRYAKRHATLGEQSRAKDKVQTRVENSLENLQPNSRKSDVRVRETVTNPASKASCNQNVLRVSNKAKRRSRYLSARLTSRGNYGSHVSPLWQDHIGTFTPSLRDTAGGASLLEISESCRLSVTAFREGADSRRQEETELVFRRGLSDDSFKSLV
jgi:hypothetical protein